MDYIFREDCIAAISTPPGRGAIGIVRLSGKGLEAVLEPLWQGRPLSELEPRRFHLGRIASPDGEIVDQALLVKFNAPESYTGEDMAELHCHGNPGLLGEALQLLCLRGARPAEPGEFTFRAFRNGRMSLLQAESVAELIHARGVWARRNALQVLAEHGDAWVQALLDDLLDIWTPIEADMEFPTDDLDAMDLFSCLPALEGLMRKMASLMERAAKFSRLQEGYRVVLAGHPNVGKSSLLNGLLGYSRALVTEIPGTTRDTLEEVFEIKGIPIRLIDTAGLGEARDFLDAQGMERSRDAIERSDLVLWMFDAAEFASGGSVKSLEEALPDAYQTSISPSLLVGNKIDLANPDDMACLPAGATLVSARDQVGLDVLLERIALTLVDQGVVHLDERIMLNQRQAAALEGAMDAVSRAIGNIRQQANQELVATDLNDARRALEDLSGQTLHADLLQSIFSRFCIGK